MEGGNFSNAKCKDYGWGDTEVPLKCLAGVCHQMLIPQWHIRGEAWSQLECGLGALHVSPPWVERHVHDQIEVVGPQWAWVLSCWHSPRECVQHWVAYSWEASHTVGRNAYSELAQNGGCPYFLTLHLPTLLYLRLEDLPSWGLMGELGLPQWRSQLRCPPSFSSCSSWPPSWWPFGLSWSPCPYFLYFTHYSSSGTRSVRAP